MTASFEESLKYVLVTILGADAQAKYDIRNRNIYRAMYLASMLGYNCGFDEDVTEPGWPVAYIDLPTGQVSWHVPKYTGFWDGHDTEEKNRRVREYIGE